MKTVGQQLSRLWLIVRELGRTPEYQEEAERLYRQLRASDARPATVVEREQEPRVRPERGHRKRAALAGLAALIVAWYLVAVAAASDAAIR